MEVTNDGKYYPQGNTYFEKLGSVHHIRYDSSLAIDNWTKNDPISGGTAYYWTRFRIESAVTTAPIFEQFKLHTNRSEINSDGWIEYFGKARPIGQLASGFSAAASLDGNLGNTPLWINQNLGVGYLDNTFTNSTMITGIHSYLPFDADTSSPIKLQWAGRFTVSHTPTFTIRWGWVKQGDTYYIDNPVVLPNLNIKTTSRPVLAGVVEEFEVNLDISKMISRRAVGQGDKLVISMQVSTLTGSFAIGPSQATYTKWCEGGHI